MIRPLKRIPERCLNQPDPLASLNWWVGREISWWPAAGVKRVPCMWGFVLYTFTCMIICIYIYIETYIYLMNLDDEYTLICSPSKWNCPCFTRSTKIFAGRDPLMSSSSSVYKRGFNMFWSPSTGNAHPLSPQMSPIMSPTSPTTIC